MTAVTRFFFRSPYAVEPTAWTVIEWWEARRLPYNLAVGTAGLISLAAIGLATLVAGGPLSSIPWQLVVAYAIAANACYSCGPVADLFIVKRWGPQYAPVGAVLFRYGFVFSVGLTLLPVPIALAAAVLMGLGVA